MGDAAQAFLDDGAANPARLSSCVTRYARWLAATGHAHNTVKQRSGELRRFVAFCDVAAVVLAGDVTRELLEEYRLHLHERRKLSSTTMHTCLVTLRRFFAFLTERRILEASPAHELVVPRRPRPLPRDVLSAREVDDVLAVIDVRTDLGLRDRALFELLYSTGLRRAEALALNIADVDTDELVVRVRAGKGGKGRMVPLGRRAAAWLTRYLDEVRPRLAAKGGLRLFLSRHGEPLSLDHLSRLGREYVAAATTKSGACHVFRHSAATVMLSRGADVRHIQELLGHDDIRTTERYTRVAIRELKAAHARFHPSA